MSAANPVTLPLSATAVGVSSTTSTTSEVFAWEPSVSVTTTAKVSPAPSLLAPSPAVPECTGLVRV